MTSKRTLACWSNKKRTFVECSLVVRSATEKKQKWFFYLHDGNNFYIWCAFALYTNGPVPRLVPQKSRKGNEKSQMWNSRKIIRKIHINAFNVSISLSGKMTQFERRRLQISKRSRMEIPTVQRNMIEKWFYEKSCSIFTRISTFSCETIIKQFRWHLDRCLPDMNETSLSIIHLDAKYNWSWT